MEKMLLDKEKMFWSCSRHGSMPVTVAFQWDEIWFSDAVAHIFGTHSPLTFGWCESNDTCYTDSYGVNCGSGGVKWLNIYAVLEGKRSWKLAYKFEQKGVLSECSNTASKAQDKHNPSHHNEEPHRVKASQICDGRQIGQHTLQGRETDKPGWLEF